MIAESFNPLPDDYEELTEDGKRQARVAVVSDDSTPQRSVVRWHYFRQWYLMPSDSFYKKFVPSAQFHYQAIHDLYTYEKNILAAPRGSAKSICIGTETPLIDLVTKPHSDTNLLLATQDMVEERFGNIQQQIDENPHIIRDFGKLKPGRGGGKWSGRYIRLRNGATLKGFGIGGRKRGARPDRLIMDDPEADKEGKEITQQLREEFDHMLFSVLLPMLREGCKIFWVGTLISRRAFIYAAFYGKDKRFGRWNRRLWAACREVDGAFTDLLWPEMLSQKYLKEQYLNMGPSAFAAEYLNAPASPQARLLTRHSVKNEYRISGQVGKFPLMSEPETTIHYLIKSERDTVDLPSEYSDVVEPYSEWLDGLFRVTLIDYAYTATVHSDFNVVMTVGFDRMDILWILDVWMGRLASEQLISVIMTQGTKWWSHMVSPESVSIQQRLMEEHARHIEDMASTTGWVPKVVPPTYPKNTQKGDRIAMALEWRFNRARIKLPTIETLQDSGYDPQSIQGFRMLEQQVDDFTPDLKLLPFDDVIDCLAMSGYIPRQSGVPRALEPFKETPLNLMKRGDKYLPGTTLLLADAVNINDIPDEVVAQWRQRQNKNKAGRPDLIETRFDHNRVWLRGL